MHALLTHPAVQAVLAPFLVALLTAELLQRMRLSGLAIIAGFAITVYLVSGFAYAPLTNIRKIIWLCIASGLLAVPLSLINWALWRPVLTVLAVASALWVTQRLLLQYPIAITLQWGAGCALFVGWLTFWMDDLQDSPIRAGSAGMALGLGTGAALLIAGSSLLGKYDLAMGSAAFAYLFIMFVSDSHLPCGRSFTLPLALVAGLTGCLAVLTAYLPWYTLLVLALIPLAAKLPVSDRSPVWVQITLLSAATLAFALGAAFLSWRIHGWAAF
ncbi:MAG TPA: hypothetical protein VMV48_03695 [Gallionellaceae bacterium]|nr:hypothetical protein [Gallionellaceae bacterium]